MKKILLMSLILMVTLLQQVTAQNRTVSGRVTDRNSGEGLPGVTILVKGTTNGVSTNSDGTYSLSVPATNGVLTFSSIGFISQERPIGQDTQINIGLAADSKALSEVVVTGYGGSQDVKDITGSVAQVKEEKLLLQPVQSFDQSLQGRMAGVQVNTTGGTVADQATIRIRGANSISSSSEPLIVVDGVPLNQVNNANTFNSANSTRYNPLADINPNDIQSVDVLKDASAAAIYGSRAANGVILITTKRGRVGQNRVSVNSYIGFQEAARLPKLLNGDDYITIQNEKATNARAGSFANNRQNTSFPAVIAADIDVNGDGVPDRTNWLDEIFRKGVQQNYQVALSGGNEFASYYGSGDWNDQQGIILTNRLRRGSGRLNIDLTPKKWLKSGISLSYSKALNHGILTDGFVAGATVSGYNAAPNVPVYNPDGSYYLIPRGLNGAPDPTGSGNLGSGNNTTTATFIAGTVNHPVAVLREQRNDNLSQRILANGYLTVEPVKGLQLTTKYGIDYLDNFEDQYSSPIISGLGRQLGSGLVQVNTRTRNQFNWQNYANYDRTFAEKHIVNLTAGVEFQETQEKQVYAGAADFADPKFQDILDNLYITNFSGGTKFANGFQSYYGRANYNFDNRYYASFTLRSDASSVFGKDNQRGYFPAGSVAWRISEEGFMKSISAVNDFKLRASYGKVGNSAGIGSYASLTTIGGGQYSDVNGFNITQVGNPTIQWETSKKLDVGFDAAFVKNRVSVTFDFFNNQIDGLLLQAPVLRTSGIPGPSFTNATVNRNIGDMYNRGVELTINTVNVQTQSGFSWSSSINASVIKNRITALASPSDIISGTQRASIGRSLGVYFLPEWAGVNPANGNGRFYAADGSIKEWDAAYATANSTTTGRWVNANGEPTAALSTDDYKYTKKSGYPNVFGGFDNTFSFKGLELGVFLQYSGGNLIYNATRAGLMTNSLNNNLDEIKDRWTTPGQETNVPRLVLRDNVSTQASTRWLEKGDFLRLRQISLGYNVPELLVKRFGLNNVRIYGLVQNAYVFTDYTGTDPEVNSNRNNSNIAYGIDSRSAPQPRSYTFGINLGI